MSDTRAYQAMPGASLGQATAGMPAAKYAAYAAATNSLPDKVADLPRLEAIANQFQQAHECLRVLTSRAGNVADKLMGSRPASPSNGEASESIDQSATHRLQRHGREFFATLELLAVEIQRLEEL